MNDQLSERDFEHLMVAFALLLVVAIYMHVTWYI